MSRPFVGQDGFYPAWARGEGRWVLQRVFTTVRGWIAMGDAVGRHAVSHEGLVWAPPRGSLNRLFRRFRRRAEARRALDELRCIPLECSNCEWRGVEPLVFEGWVALAGEFMLVLPRDNPDPANWRLRCPHCHLVVGPQLCGLDVDVIVRQWNTLGRPVLDPPAAAPMIERAKPIFDLEEWIERTEPMENELAYVGQQLWNNFSDFISHAAKRGKRRRPGPQTQQ